MGWAIVQNASTGEILAAEAIGEKSSGDTPWIDCQEELGGLVLPFIVASALDSGAVTADSIFDVSVKEEVGGAIIKDHSRGTFAIPDLVARSSTCGGAKIALALGDTAANAVSANPEAWNVPLLRRDVITPVTCDAVRAMLRQVVSGNDAGIVAAYIFADIAQGISLTALGESQE